MIPKKPVIAFLYDFDKTLCTKDMQEYSFIPEVHMEPVAFWQESNGLAKNHKMDRILASMYLMLQKAREAKESLCRENFVTFGHALQFFPGVEDWFARINRLGEEFQLTVEHYVISSGLREIIEGSSIYPNFREVFASEYFYDEKGDAIWPKNMVNYTTKTQFLYRVNKGVLDISNDDDLNKFTADEKRAVPFRNMIYIGDGLTDVPCMRLVKENGGSSIAVYQKGKREAVEELLKHERVDFITLADYTEHSELDDIVRDIICKMAMVERLYRKNQEQLVQIKTAADEG
ncbi:MAG TPA: HAD family hydrolase [Bacillota bacterium]|nr:HAD family hydrolase [Bacillota bacterium]